MREDWSYTEQCLQPLASSMGHLLAMIRPHISTPMINGRDWECLLDRALEMPAAMGAFPFGFEIPLQDSRPKADFGVSLVGDSLTSKIYRDRGRAKNAGSSDKNLTWLLNEMDRQDSPLCRIVGKKMLLEYDVDTVSNNALPDPGIFLYPVYDALAGGSEKTGELRAVHDALVHVGGWNQDSAEFRQLERLYGIMTPNIMIRAMGTFPSRRRGIRIAVTGFRKPEEVLDFLVLSGWTGSGLAVSDVVEFLDQHQAYAYLGLHFDVAADGIGPVLGLSVFAREKEWLKDIKPWTPAINAIRERELALPDKLTELHDWSTGATTLFTRLGAIMLVRGIHHLKFTITNDRFNAVKAYVFFLLMASRPS